MPFLNQLARWNAAFGASPAAGIVTEELTSVLTYDQLTRLALSMPIVPTVNVLAEFNSLDLVVKIVAGIAQQGMIALLDPALPGSTRQDMSANISSIQVPEAPPESEARGLVDGPAESLFLLGFTSGTTSTPKAFTRTRESWRVSFERSCKYFQLTHDETTLIAGPLTASLNLYALGECLYAGSPVYLLPRFSASAVTTALRRDHITRLVVVPTMLRWLTQRGVQAGESWPEVRSIVCAGAKLDADTVRLAQLWAPAATIYEYYGAAELGFVAAEALPSLDPPTSTRARTAVGKAFPGVDLEVRDAAGRTLAPGEPGDIYVRSPLVSEGYVWGDDGLAFRRQGDWCTVADQGYLTEDGELHVLGRAADMLNCAGHNVYPQEVELALCGIAGVREAVVFGLPDGLRGHRIVAGIKSSAGSAGRSLRAAGLHEGISAYVPIYKRPQQYFLLSELPLTSAGKISRTLLADWISTKDARAHRLP